MTSPQDPFATPDGTPAEGQPAPPAPPGSPPPATGGYGAPPAQSGWPSPSGGSKNGLGVAALVLGVLALLTSWFLLGGLIGIAAIVLGVVGLGRVKRGEASNKGSAIAGIVLGAISILIAGALIAAGAAFFFSDSGQELTECIEQAAGDPAAEAQCEAEFQDSLES